jgi:hypothetical protein
MIATRKKISSLAEYGAAALPQSRSVCKGWVILEKKWKKRGTGGESLGTGIDRKRRLVGICTGGNQQNYI